MKAKLAATEGLEAAVQAAVGIPTIFQGTAHGEEFNAAVRALATAAIQLQTEVARIQAEQAARANAEAEAAEAGQRRGYGRDRSTRVRAG